MQARNEEGTRALNAAAAKQTGAQWAACPGAITSRSHRGDIQRQALRKRANSPGRQEFRVWREYVLPTISKILLLKKEDNFVL
jgi:hypothetical protein